MMMKYISHLKKRTEMKTFLIKNDDNDDDDDNNNTESTLENSSSSSSVNYDIISFMEKENILMFCFLVQSNYFMRLNVDNSE